ncbi:hypothetical protein ACIQUS_18125 [Pseudomonas sp. NPDC090755]
MDPLYLIALGAMVAGFVQGLSGLRLLRSRSQPGGSGYTPR